MPDDLLNKDGLDNLPSQPIEPQPAKEVNSEAQVKFNPSGQIEDIFENTEKTDDKGGQAGFKVRPGTESKPDPEQNKELKPQYQPAVSMPSPTELPTFSKGTSSISKPHSASMTHESEFDDEPISSKKRYFVIGLIGIFIIASGLVYWFIFRESTVEIPVDQTNIEQQEDLIGSDFINTDPQSPEVTEPDNGDIISNPPQNDNINQMVVDSDQDGLSDEEETSLGTNLMKADSDGDGLYDREEVKVYLTDPINADTDNDGYLDGEEVVAGFNPKGEGSFLPPIQ